MLITVHPHRVGDDVKGHSMRYRLDADQTATIRTWARDTGHPVGTRGRLRADLITQYVEAHPDCDIYPVNELTDADA